MSFPAPQGVTPKKSNRGCVIMLAVLGGVVLLGIVVAGVATYMVASSKEGRQVISTVVDGAKMIQDAQHAPGTDELRKLGCADAMVMDMEQLAKLAAQFDDAAAVPAEQVSLMVTCQVGLLGDPPSCADVVRAYLGAAPVPAKNFSVTVSKQGGGSPDCSNLYAPDGTMLLDLKAGAVAP